MALIKKTSLLRDSLLVIITIVVGTSWIYDLQIEERVIAVRYLILASAGFISFVTPYLLFPDSNSKLIQLGNISDSELLNYLSGKTSKIYKFFYLFIFVMMFADVSSPAGSLVIKLVYSLYAMLMVAGLHYTALFLYLKVGPQSQFWQESQKGQELRRKVAEYAKYPIDPGAIPSLLNTVLLAALGMSLLVIATLLGNSFGHFAELTIGFLLIAFGRYKFFRGSKHPEKRYYHTNSFFSEFFGESAGEDSITARRKVEQLWWVPSKLRANVWQFLQQTDRKLPAGRVVAAGHILVWLVAYQRPDDQFMIGVWALFAVTHHLFILQAVQTSFSPMWLLRWMSSPMVWLFSWFWMQMRWLLPLTVSMNAQLFIFGVPGWRYQGIVLSIYLITALAVSAAGVFRLKKSMT
ncbi:hypothetical protein [Rhodohalobacter halophilus]|uniref:hypothetical protein n=1 Tax=Rhodohalobacter halophilus TaxID=1812810 RepID=UPI000A0232DE|nr:hypothetical protein [Rhodohalobacter halophilus]